MSAALQPFTLSNRHGLEVDVLPLGATIMAIRYQGQLLTLGYPQPEQYLHDNFYLGATVGRYANRIAHGRCLLNGQLLQLDCNNGPHSLHGGSSGFNKAVWQVRERTVQQAELYYCAADGEQGFPGRLQVWLQLQLQQNALHLQFRGLSDRDTLVNLTNHCYFNLNSDGNDINNHQLRLNAEHYLPTDSTAIPYGELQPVAGSVFDLRQPAALGERLLQGDLQLQQARGFDHCFVTPQGADGSLQWQATVSSPQSGRTLEVFSTQPGIQLYTGNYLAAPFRPRQGLCLEAQNWPDAPNQPHFPSAQLAAGQTYQQEIVYRFS
ncbi:aldose epimerase family protein [Chromatiaceae bacterium AAb-1]|nr:aldose epimerase family protein [Chromatiaceae bacterium AAb-1]